MTTFEKILLGWFIGGIFVIITLGFIIENNPQTTFKSKKKIKPDYELTTNGKVVDTAWVYKICF